MPGSAVPPRPSPAAPDHGNTPGAVGGPRPVHPGAPPVARNPGWTAAGVRAMILPGFAEACDGRGGAAAMLEVEMKFPVADFEPVRERLAQWGARSDHEAQETDVYFNAPDRDFART